MRGFAYLAAHRGEEAAAEFQKVLDHRGIVVSDPIGAMAHLGLASTYPVEAGFSPARKHAALKGAATGAQPDGDRRAPLQPYAPQEALLKRAGETPALQKARAAYQDFLTLWKDADPNIPVFKQAKKEYARLQ